MSKRDEAVGKLYEAQTKMQEANALIAEANHELQRLGIDRFARELRDLRDELARTLQATYGYTRMIETTPEPAPEAGVCPKCGGWTNKCLCDL